MSKRNAPGGLFEFFDAVLRELGVVASER